MCLDGLITPSLVVSLNGAFLPPAGLVGQFFSPAAKFMSAIPFVPQLFSWRAGDPAVLQRLVDGTGSKLDATGLALYAKLAGNPGHTAGALGMMAHWDLPQLSRDLFRLKTALCMVVGSNDLTISPDQADAVLAMLPSTRSSPKTTLTTLPGLGHLAHEEQPEMVAAVVQSQFLAAIQG
jgi:magnesium chelatase accessory protein